MVSEKRRTSLREAWKKRKAKWPNGMPPWQRTSLKEVHNRPEVKERHRQATLKRLSQESHLPKRDTPIELKLRSAMEEAGISFSTQQKLLNKYIVDFLVTGKPLIIEADGYSHRLPRGKARDEIRDSNLIAAGYTVMRFPGFQIHLNSGGCAKEIRKVMDSLPGEVPSTMVVIIGNQNGASNPMYGKIPWNKGISTKTNAKWKEAYARSRETCKKNGFGDRIKARWAEYRSKTDWNQVLIDYSTLHSAKEVSKKHGIGKNQVYHFLRKLGVALNGRAYNKGRPPKYSSQDIV